MTYTKETKAHLLWLSGPRRSACHRTKSAAMDALQRIADLEDALRWVIEHDETTAHVQNKCAEAIGE